MHNCTNVTLPLPLLLPIIDSIVEHLSNRLVLTLLQSLGMCIVMSLTRDQRGDWPARISQIFYHPQTTGLFTRKFGGFSTELLRGFPRSFVPFQFNNIPRRA
jgi:hypothetical protein